LSLLGYKRRIEATNTSGGLMRLSLPADSAKAVSENEDFFIGANRVDESLGEQLEYSALTDWFDAPNTIKVGVSGESYPLKEFFTFAVVNPALSTPAGEPGGSESGDDRLEPYDLTKGGKPFLVDQSKTGNRISAYAQDQIAFKDWIVNAGLRFDMFSLFDDESAISPRLSAAYHASDDLWLRASYNRIVMQAPIENILVSSSDEAAQLVGSEQGGVPTRVSSEKEHVLELGASYKLNDNIDLDLNTYAKFIEDFIVKVELGVSGIIFPVNLKEGQVFGGDLEMRLHNWNNISGKLSVGSCLSMGKKPEDGSNPIAAGLILGEEGDRYAHPFGGEDIFPTEHNQLLTASFVFNYEHPCGFFATLGGRFDSGLPFDLTDSAGNGVDATQAREILKERGYSDDVIDLLSLEGEVENGKISPDKSTAPHFVLDAGVGFDFQPDLKIPAKITATVMNVLDTKYLYKFESSFGGTHFGLPRMVVVGLQIKL
ncbi:MAG TPA: TonB-dependent receptor, partial [Candidatus Kapabacteria bacterium]|nr:TonB-dependent receptor [Candidatus Kapabacteria bacterium]